MSNQNHPILLSRQNAILTLTLNRPRVLNAIDLQMAESLKRHLIYAGQDASVRALVITGNGRGFCSGGDLRFALEANPHTPGQSFLALTNILHASIEEIRRMSKPVIAAINGPAAGAGLFLALACDLRIMADTAFLKQSNTSYGLSLPAGGSFLLPRLVGMGRALEIVMLDEPISATHALELGLVSRVYTGETLLQEAYNLAQRVQTMPVGVLGRVKRMMNNAFFSTLNEQLEIERQELAASANSAEGREGLAAFVQKRRPNFTTTV